MKTYPLQSKLSQKLSEYNIRISITVFTDSGSAIGSTFTRKPITVEQGSSPSFSVVLARPRLSPGPYYMAIAIGKGNDKEGHYNYDVISNLLHFNVLNQLCDDGALSYWSHTWGNICFDSPEINPQTSR